MFSAFQSKIIVAAALVVVFTLYQLHSTSTTLINWPSTTKSTPPQQQQPSPKWTKPVESAEGMAAYLSPAELMARPLLGNSDAIPKLIHQSWKTSELPAKFLRWSESCRRQHPDWQWVLWTDEDNLRLVDEFVPGMRDVYNNLKGPIMRADIVRNAYMYLFGGVYMDLDTDCLQPSDTLFAEFSVSTMDASPESHTHLVAKDTSSGIKQKAFVGKMGTDDNFEHNTPNAWMASPPGHPFFRMMLQWATQKVSTSLVLDERPEAITGPIALRSGIKRFRKGNFGLEALILPSIFSDAVKDAYTPSKEGSSRPLEKDATIQELPFHYIYPYSWHRDGDAFRKFCASTRDTFDADRCKELIAVDHWPSWTITYWSHTWNNADDNLGNIKKLDGDKG